MAVRRVMKVWKTRRRRALRRPTVRSSRCVRGAEAKGVMREGSMREFWTGMPHSGQLEAQWSERRL